MTLKFAAMALIGLAFATQATAQRYVMRGPNGEPLESGEMIVPAQRSLSLPFAPGADPSAQREEAVRLLYRMASRECGLLLETIADDCVLISVSTSASSDESSGQRVRASANFSMKTRLKGAVTPAAPAQP